MQLYVKPPLTFRSSNGSFQLPPTSPSRQPAGQGAVFLGLPAKWSARPAQRMPLVRETPVAVRSGQREWCTKFQEMLCFLVFSVDAVKKS